MNQIDLEKVIGDNDTLIELSEECEFSVEGACGHGAGGAAWPMGGFLLYFCF